jgi:general secretion pathway protein E
MGVEPFLISSSLVACVAQRLVRLLCTQCRESYTPSEEELAEIGLNAAEVYGREIYRAKGCNHCHGGGYRGRTAIYELLIVDDAIRQLITRGIDSKTIHAEAVRRGMRTLRGDGARRVLEGLTSVAEVLRQTEEDFEPVEAA